MKINWTSTASWLQAKWPVHHPARGTRFIHLLHSPHSCPYIPSLLLPVSSSVPRFLRPFILLSYTSWSFFLYPLCLHVQHSKEQKSWDAPGQSCLPRQADTEGSVQLRSGPRTLITSIYSLSFLFCYISDSSCMAPHLTNPPKPTLLTLCWRVDQSMSSSFSHTHEWNAPPTLPSLSSTHSSVL